MKKGIFNPPDRPVYTLVQSLLAGEDDAYPIHAVLVHGPDGPYWLFSRSKRSEYGQHALREQKEEAEGQSGAVGSGLWLPTGGKEPNWNPGKGFVWYVGEFPRLHYPAGDVENNVASLLALA